MSTKETFRGNSLLGKSKQGREFLEWVHGDEPLYQCDLTLCIAYKVPSALFSKDILYKDSKECITMHWKSDGCLVSERRLLERTLHNETFIDDVNSWSDSQIYFQSLVATTKIVGVAGVVVGAGYLLYPAAVSSAGTFITATPAVGASSTTAAGASATTAASSVSATGLKAAGAISSFFGSAVPVRICLFSICDFRSEKA